ncbi:acetyl-CoA carboxylase biotin carboxyl carrier protein [Hathewaya proteolytica DSM 3090]|uniref:Biotin carboxyl carrier protein of acetyl-CoA carboxylase n=1 Tax=Hathewaya proteolytica DSM 3090 TaxID=1121331 RepID=A0A1M6M2D0_9CLOT|nr:biotin/lipoyl-containing protein [Hathewaya proteolytica]SHJ77598.1 acetyl-CoA carboxylase biotin carboxyl carrier protein [Hathewaya proteolytica DSM 3090]
MNYENIKDLVVLFNSMDIDLMELREQDFSIKLEKNKSLLNTNNGDISPNMSCEVENNRKISLKEKNLRESKEENSIKDNDVKDNNLQKIKAPLVGVFYQSQAPGQPPFVEVGKFIKKGDVIGIIEAMKMINEIKSPYTGTVRSILISNEQLISFDEVLMEIEVEKDV